MQPNTLNTNRSIIHIKNMVCDRCIRVIREEFIRTGFIQVHNIDLGHAEISYNAQVITMDGIGDILKRNGFAILTDKDAQLVEQIKIAIVQLIYFGNNTNSLIRNSDFLSEKFELPYAHLSKVFSEKTNVTLEKYIIQIKIEKVKELISYNELTLSEISYMMGYSSVQYLSNQFKQLTGIAVTDYKKNDKKTRISLDKVIG